MVPIISDPLGGVALEVAKEGKEGTRGLGMGVVFISLMEPSCYRNPSLATIPRKVAWVAPVGQVVQVAEAAAAVTEEVPAERARLAVRAAMGVSVGRELAADAMWRRDRSPSSARRFSLIRRLEAREVPEVAAGIPGAEAVEVMAALATKAGYPTEEVVVLVGQADTEAVAE